MKKNILPQLKKLLIVLALNLLLIVIAGNQAEAENFQTGQNANAILDIGVGGRAVALGEAYTALADDATSIYWNPAGLGRVQKTELLFMHSLWLQNLPYEYAALALPVSSLGTLAISLSYLDYGSMTRMDDFGNSNGTFKAFDLVGSLGFGFCFSSEFSAGTTLKLPYTALDDKSYASLVIDAGFQYRPSNNWFQWGLALENFGTRVGQANQPSRVKIGMGCVNTLPGLTIAVDAGKGFYSNGIGGSVGLEYSLGNMFLPRVGYRYEQDENGLRGLTAGLGIQLPLNAWQIRLDYAYVPYGDLGNTHRLAISFF